MKRGINLKNTMVQFVCNILKSNDIPVHYLNIPLYGQEYKDFFCDFDLGLRNRILGITDFPETGRQWFSSRNPSVIYFETDIFLCNYILLFLPENENWLFCGPVLLEEISEERFNVLTADLNIPIEFHANMKFYYDHMPFFPSGDIFKSMFCELGNYLYGKDNFELQYHDNNDLDLWHYNYKNYLHISDAPFSNIDIIEARYKAENTMMDAISNCNESAALEAITKFHAYMLPQRQTNKLRDMKDYTITFNTLLRKSAEQAGVHPIHIDSHSNGTIMLIEQVTSVNQCIAFQKKMIHEYCELIRRHSLKDYSPLIGKTLTYINAELCANLSLNRLAKHLNVNASYLSMLFKKEVGITLTDYVNNHRIKHAQKLLLCTNLPIKSIALQCGISDIYYFTRLFKRITGTTPKAFRVETPHEVRCNLLRLRNY